MQTSAPDLEGRTYVAWWALPLAIPLVVLLVLAAGAFALAVSALIASLLVMNEIPGGPLSELVIALLVTFAFGSVCEAAADRLLNRHRWRARHLRSGRCPWCRYDIRGLPARRCPECGQTWEPDAIQSGTKRRSPR